MKHSHGLKSVVSGVELVYKPENYIIATWIT